MSELGLVPGAWCMVVQEDMCLCLSYVSQLIFTEKIKPKTIKVSCQCPLHGVCDWLFLSQVISFYGLGC